MVFKEVLIDTETDSLNPTKLWCVVCMSTIDRTPYTFHGPNMKSKFKKFVASHTNESTKWIAHNMLGFDIKVMKSFLDLNVPLHCAIDTLVLSRMLNYKIAGGHSLEAWGHRLRYPKKEFKDFSKFSFEMLDYCINDVNVLYSLYTSVLKPKLLDKEIFKEAIDIEHFIAYISENELTSNGFYFDYDKATGLYKHIIEYIKDLEDNISKEFKPTPKLVKEIIPKLNKNGSLYSSNLRSLNNTIGITAGCPFSLIEWVPFNPSSTKQVIERLNRIGWRPTEKTKGHKNNEDHSKSYYYKKYGWKVNERNLSTVPDNAPSSVNSFVMKRMLDKRRSTLEEWFDAYDETTHRIHGTFNHIGTWTHRMSHNNPNMGNAPSIASKFKTKEVSEQANSLGKEMRSLWTVPQDGCLLVGTDADSIQLRILAHYMNDETFTHSIVSGNKKEGTDAHSLNMKALGPVCRDRDNSKTFIYAWILGASDTKIGEILNCSVKQAKEAVQRFVSSYPGLVRLKKEVIPRDAKRGYFQGLDGRYVLCDSEHHMLAGYLQNGEAVVMKHALLKWTNDLESLGVNNYRLVNFVHDEWQTEVKGDVYCAEYIGGTQVDAIRYTGKLFKMNCPLDGQFKIGKNWYDTH